MKIMNKTTKLLTVLLLAFIISGCSSGDKESNANSDDETNVLQLSHSGSDEMIMHKEFEKYTEELEEEVDGRLEFDIRPNAQLGGDREAFESVQNGDFAGVISNLAVVSNVIPETAVFDIPFLFDSEEEARHVMRPDGPVFEKLASLYEDIGLKLVAFNDLGFRSVTTSDTPVTSIEDFKDLKIRTAESQNHVDSWKALGANPTPVPFSEVYTSLQQGTIDAQESAIELTVASKLFEPQNFFVKSDRSLLIQQVVLNLDFYENLPEDIKKHIDEGIPESFDDIAIKQDKRNEELEQFLTDEGLTITEISDEEMDKIREKTAPITDNIREQVGDELVDLLLEDLESFKQ